MKEQPQGTLAFADATTEDEVLKGILVEVSKRGFLVWRNNSGALFETFPAGQLGGRDVFFRGRLVKFGLVGSPDVIGFCRKCGAFVAIEAKRPKGGVVRDAQLNFGAICQRSRAIYGIARTVAEAVRVADYHRFRCHL